LEKGGDEDRTLSIVPKSIMELEYKLTEDLEEKDHIIALVASGALLL